MGCVGALGSNDLVISRTFYISKHASPQSPGNHGLAFRAIGPDNLVAEFISPPKSVHFQFYSG